MLELPWENPEGYGDDFTLNRKVINFEIFDEDKPVTSFSSPIRLYLAYTGDDLDYAYNNNKLFAFAFLNDDKRWVKFQIDKHGYTLLRTQDNGNTFETWDWSGNWISLELYDTYYKIGDEELDRSQLKTAYQMLSTFPNIYGFAFVHVKDWGDRHIGAGG